MSYIFLYTNLENLMSDEDFHHFWTLAIEMRIQLKRKTPNEIVGFQ